MRHDWSSISLKPTRSSLRLCLKTPNYFEPLKTRLPPTSLRESGLLVFLRILRCTSNRNKILEAIQRLPNVFLAGISTLIKEKGVTAGNITRKVIQTTIRDLLLDAGLTAHAADKPQAVQTKRHRGYYVWEGGMHMQPEDFEFPSVDTLSGFKLWWLDNESQGYLPFRLINTRDLSSRRTE